MNIYKIGYAGLGLVGLFLASQEIQAQSLPPLSPMTQVAVGGDETNGSHTCALGNTGTVWCWGSNYNGELGNRSHYKTSVPNLLPMVVDGLSGFTVDAIGLGSHHSCAAGHSGPNPTGGMVCWGANDYGELGNGKNTTTNYPVVVSLPTGIGVSVNATNIALGRLHSCVITAAKGVMCWGSDDDGQIGDNCPATPNCLPRLSPVAVIGLANVTAISAGTYHTCALINGGPTGTVKCWGQSFDGKLGNPGVTSRRSDVPVPVLLNATPLTGVRAIAAGDSHTCAVMDSGTVKCWGSNRSGQLGTPNIVSGGPQPVDVKLFSDATDLNIVDNSDLQVITAGFRHTCVITLFHHVQCWGNNSAKELGRNSANSSDSPGYVLEVNNMPLANVFGISSHYQHTCARTLGGYVKCWGANESGQIGDNTIQTAPIAKPTVADQIFANGFEAPRAN